MTVGERIKKFRKLNGMTQEQLAQLSGYSVMSIRRYESGERLVNYEAIGRISNALKIHGNDLLDMDPKDFNIDKFPPGETFNNLMGSMDEFVLRFNEEKILEHLSKLNAIGQAKAVERIEELTKIPDYQKEEEPAETE